MINVNAVSVECAAPPRPWVSAETVGRAVLLLVQSAEGEPLTERRLAELNAVMHRDISPRVPLCFRTIGWDLVKDEVRPGLVRLEFNEEYGLKFGRENSLAMTAAFHHVRLDPV